MQSHIKQRGGMLFSMFIIGLLVVLGIVYGREFVNIPYTKYKLQTMVENLLKVEAKSADAQIRVKFMTLVSNEQMSDIVNVDNIDITRSNDITTITLSYRHCASISTIFEFCAEQEFERSSQ